MSPLPTDQPFDLALFPAPARSSPELVLLVGPPLSGKSVLFQRYLSPHGYTLFPRPMARNSRADALEDLCDQGLKGKGMVIDRKVTTRKDRAKWIEVAERHDVPVRSVCLALPYFGVISRSVRVIRRSPSPFRCIFIDPPSPEMTRHTDLYRQHYHSQPSRLAEITSYETAFEVPDAALEDGIDLVIQMQHVGWIGDDAKERRRWEGFLNEGKDA